MSSINYHVLNTALFWLFSLGVRVTCLYQRSCNLSSRKSNDSMFKVAYLSLDSMHKRLNLHKLLFRPGAQRVYSSARRQKV